MNDHPTLFDLEHPGARATDPDTSLEAASSARARQATIARLVLRALYLAAGPLTHDELVAGWPSLAPHTPATPSGIRSRVAELVKAGLVDRDPVDGLSATGRRAARWRITAAGVDQLRAAA